MNIKQGKYIKYLISLSIFFLVLFQFWHINCAYKNFSSLKTNLKSQRTKNLLLKAEYKNFLNSCEADKEIILAKQSSKIIFKAENLGLKIIDFSSSEYELNLNFKGNFHSILKLFYYLENNLGSSKIAEFKIKTDRKELFLFIKLRDERV